MLASRVLITAGTPGHMYLDDRQAKCLMKPGKNDKIRICAFTLIWSIKFWIKLWFFHFYALNLNSRHGLVYRFHSITHSKLIHNLLRRLFKIDLPGIVAFSIWDLYHAVVLKIRHIVEEILQDERDYVIQKVLDCKQYSYQFIHITDLLSVIYL